MSTTSSSASPAATSARGSKVAEWVTGRDGQLSLDFDGGPPQPPVLLTERQACGLMSIGRTTLRSIPQLRPKHIGRCVRYLLSDVERYIAGLT